MTELDRDQELPSDVVVYGAGGFGWRLVEGLHAAGVRVAAVADRSAGGSVAGAPRVSPNAAIRFGLPIVIGVSNPHVDAPALARELAQGGALSVWSPVQIAIALKSAGQRLDNYWMTGDLSIYGASPAEMQLARSGLQDDASVRLFDSTVAYRTQGALEALLPPDPLGDQYAPRNLVFLTSGMRFVDAGAFDGDTVRTLLERGAAVTAYLGLEPDPASFVSLAAQVRSTSWPDALCLPLALSDEARLLRFSADGTGSAAFATEGSTTVQAVTLDGLAPNWRPTHIKMDIEGAEAAALAGMARTLSEARPRLAVSVYHRPADLWEIQNWISSLDVGYRFALRCYGHQTFDTVLYCVPE